MNDMHITTQWTCARCGCKTQTGQVYCPHCAAEEQRILAEERREPKRKA